MRPFVLAATLLVTPSLAWAQSSALDLSAAFEAAAVFSDNVALQPDDSGIDSQQFVFTVSPSVTLELPLRIVDLYASYRLTYFTYTDSAPRRTSDTHNAAVSGALTYWEGVDLVIGNNLEAVSQVFGQPADEPEALVQRNTLYARFGIEYALGKVAKLRFAYDLDRVDYFEKLGAPAYLYHGPELSFGRNFNRALDLGVGYEFRLQDFDTDPAAGDLSYHHAFLKTHYEASRWNSLDVKLGVQYVVYGDSTVDPTVAFSGKLGLNFNPTQYLGFVLGGSHRNTTDIEGNPAQQTEANLTASVLPVGKFLVQATAAYGRLNLEDLDPLVTSLSPPEERSYIRGEIGLEYEWIKWISTRASFSHHRFDSDVTGLTSVNRGLLSVIAKYE